MHSFILLLSWTNWLGLYNGHFLTWSAITLSWEVMWLDCNSLNLSFVPLKLSCIYRLIEHEFGNFRLMSVVLLSLVLNDYGLSDGRYNRIYIALSYLNDSNRLVLL